MRSHRLTCKWGNVVNGLWFCLLFAVGTLKAVDINLIYSP